MSSRYDSLSLFFFIKSIFKILNRFGTQVYKADEERTGCCNTCYGSKREFTINLYDASARSFLKFHRPKKACDIVCCGHHTQPDKINCTATNGEEISSIHQQKSKGFCWGLDCKSITVTTFVSVYL